MTVETAQFIDELVAANPSGSDPTAEGDDQIRLIKAVLQNTFPNATSALTSSNTVLSGLDGRVSTLETAAIREDGSNAFTGNQSMGSNRLTNLAAPTSSSDAARLSEVNAEASARSSAIQALFPVGSLVMNTTGTNPASYLGFGTWQNFSEGRVLVGQGGGFTLGSSGGASSQSVPIPAHTHGIFAADAASGGSGLTSRSQTTRLGASLGNSFSYEPVQSSTATTGSFFGSTSQEGTSSASISTLQPYVTIAIFRRSA